MKLVWTQLPASVRKVTSKLLSQRRTPLPSLWIVDPGKLVTSWKLWAQPVGTTVTYQSLPVARQQQDNNTCILLIELLAFSSHSWLKLGLNGILIAFGTKPGGLESASFQMLRLMVYSELDCEFGYLRMLDCKTSLIVACVAISPQGRKRWSTKRVHKSQSWRLPGR